MCGIVGIYSQAPVATELYDSLVHLQHRGQDAAGMITSSGKFYVRHGLGYVREIFTADDMQHLKGNIGIAHVRYPTAGGRDIEDVQPLWTGSPRGIALAHNGNLINHAALSAEMTQQKHRHLNSSSDSEVLLHLLAEGLEAAELSGLAGAQVGETQAVRFARVAAAVAHVFAHARGSYSVISKIIGRGLLAFRDPHGIRPLVCGRRPRADFSGQQAGVQYDYIFSSETTMFQTLGFEQVGDVLPGEVVFVDLAGRLFRKVITRKQFSPCIFEHVYFARPDSVMDGVSVYAARRNMGMKLAEQWQATYPGLLPEVVVPAPFTSNTAAMAFAQKLKVRYAEGLYKNSFIGRTFIMPDEKQRTRNIRYKLTPQKAELEGRCVLILDDSIVRGTTSREIIRLVRDAGAREIYFVSACPPVRHPCFYGIDMPSHAELIATGRTEEEIRVFLGADRLLYQAQAKLVEAVREGRAQADTDVSHPCMACLDGNYVAGKS